MNDTLMDQCRREAEERYPLTVDGRPYASRRHEIDRDQVHCRLGYAAALYAERSKRPPTVQQIMDAAVEVFELGPEDQDDVLRFGMKVQDMQGPPMITVDEAMGIIEPLCLGEATAATIRKSLTAAATNNTNDNG